LAKKTTWQYCDLLAAVSLEIIAHRTRALAGLQVFVRLMQIAPQALPVMQTPCSIWQRLIWTSTGDSPSAARTDV